MATECICPAEIREGDLLAFVEGVATAGISRHVARCPACAAEVAALSIADGVLAVALDRERCPPVDMLLRYAARLLPDAQAGPLGTHLAGCAACRAELARLAVDEDPAPSAAPSRPAAGPSLWGRIAEGGRALLTAVLAPLEPAGTLALRGSSAAGHTYHAGAFDILLTVAPPLVAEAGRAVEGQLVDREGALSGPITVRLLREGRLVARDDLDEFGYFTLGQVGPGLYALEFDLPDVSIRIEDVQV